MKTFPLPWDPLELQPKLICLFHYNHKPKSETMVSLYIKKAHKEKNKLIIEIYTMRMSYTTSMAQNLVILNYIKLSVFQSNFDKCAPKSV